VVQEQERVGDAQVRSWKGPGQADERSLS
jgi:hypothetical protein